MKAGRNCRLAVDFTENECEGVAVPARTPAEIERWLTSLMLDIALDGVVLYDREGYAERRLAALRRLIERRGLRRERVGKDLVWRWEKFPGFDWELEMPR